VDAVRKRVERGHLPHEREGSRLYILLDEDATESRPNVEGESSALMSQMQDRIDSLERQLDQANERDRENRRIIAALTSRIPELPAARASPDTPSEPRRAPEAAETEPVEPTPSEPQRGPQEAGEPRSWWSRWFGG
jgi:hypothetical protein